MATGDDVGGVTESADFLGNPVGFSEAIRRVAPLTDRRKIDISRIKQCADRKCVLHEGPHRHIRCEICGEDRPLVSQADKHTHVHKAHHDVYAILGWRKGK